MATLVWASPNSLLGLGAGLVGVLTGGDWQVREGVIECWGGRCSNVLARLPNGPIAALTLGHVVVARNRESLDQTRAHERVHVRQYERWGPAFLPAYGLFALVLWARGRDPYRENPFEIEAYRQAP